MEICELFPEEQEVLEQAIQGCGKDFLIEQ